MELLDESDDSDEDADFKLLMANRATTNMNAPNTTTNAQAVSKVSNLPRNFETRAPRMSIINKESDDSDEDDNEYVKQIMA